MIGLLALPFLGFSQQQEEPKRVTVVVKSTEVSTQKEIVQLPADNLPKVISSKPITKSNRTVSTKQNSVPAAVAPKEKTIVAKVEKKAEVKPENKPSIAKTIASPKKEVIPVKKTEVAQAKTTIKKEQPVIAKTASTNKPKDAAKPNVSVTREVTQVGDETITTIKAQSDNEVIAKVSHSSKVNSFSYIWIGIFLIVAGVVLGLLFGKPAFLISFVGVVFITLGLVI